MSKLRHASKKAGRGLYLTVSILLVIAIGAAIAWIMNLGANRLPLRQYFPRTYTNAVWDWQNPITTSSSGNLEDISEFMYLHQLNALYLNTGAYASIMDGAMTPQKAAEKQQLDSSIDRYVTTLAKHHIKVYAVAGDVNWSNPPQWHIPLSVLTAVEQYNQSHPHARLAGVEFDIEAYNQPGFPASSMTAKGLVLGDYLSLVNQLVKADATYVNQHPGGLELGFAIPYWFDNENGNIPSVTWNNKTGPTLYHLLDTLEQLPKSNVVVMAYRNQAKGNDGVIFHSRTEVEYAQAKDPRVRVLIGQETTDVQPSKITYYGESASNLSNQVTLTEQAFSGDSTFGGIAIEDLNGYRQLQDTP